MKNQFDRLSHEEPALIPAGYSAPLDMRPARQIESDRKASAVAHDLHAAFAKDIEGKMRDALIAMGWVPPTTALVVTAAVSDALEAAVRKGVAVHWDYLARDLLAAHEALTRR